MIDVALQLTSEYIFVYTLKDKKNPMPLSAFGMGFYFNKIS